MFKKIVVDCKSKKTAFSSGYTVPQGKVFLLTGLMVRKREYTDKYSNNTIERVDVTTSIYILNQDGSGFKSGGYHSDQNKFDGNQLNMKGKFFLEGETIFAGMYDDYNSYGGEITILGEETDNI